MKNPRTGNKWKVYVAIPSMGTIHDFLPFVLREWQERYGDDIEFVFPAQLCQRIFHDAARNGVVEEFLETDCDILWSIDSDIAPPKHLPELITMHGDKWLVAGAPYPVFMAQPGESQRQIVFTVYKGVKNGGKGLAPCPVPHSGTDWVDGIATGCMMIKRELFERLEKPYFEFKFDPITRQPIEGEDLGFCLKLKKLGIPIFTDYSMVCKHTKTLCLLEMNNYAIEFANKSVMNYDSQVRKQVESLVSKVNELQAQLKSARSPKSNIILK